MNKIKIAPSILSADFSDIGSAVKKIEQCGADMVHCDVMDGMFVPNITFGPKMIADIRKTTKLPLDAHLMIVEPERYIKNFAQAGADYITVHYEACKDLRSVLTGIKSLGIKCGAVISPDTDADVLEEYSDIADMFLIMSVYPGFGGQSYIEGSEKKLKTVADIIKKSGRDIRLEIDGGISEKNCNSVISAGADVIVAGSAVFGAADMSAAIKVLRG